MEATGRSKRMAPKDISVDAAFCSEASFECLEVRRIAGYAVAAGKGMALRQPLAAPISSVFQLTGFILRGGAFSRSPSGQMPAAARE